MPDEVLSINTFLTRLVIWYCYENQIEFTSRLLGSQSTATLDGFSLQPMREGTEPGIRRA